MITFMPSECQSCSSSQVCRDFLDSETPRLLALILVTSRHATSVSSPGVVQLAVVEVAVSTVWLAVLVEIVSVEVLARLAETGLLVGRVQGHSVVVAGIWVVWAWEEVVTHAVLWCVDTLSTTVLWWAWWVWLWGWWSSNIGAVVAI